MLTSIEAQANILESIRMIHITLWLNIVALAAFFAAVSLALLSWIHKPYVWVKIFLWYLASLALYQFVFTFYFFARLYVDGIPQVFLNGLLIVQAALSTVSVLLLPLSICKLLCVKVTPARAAAIAFPVACMIVAMPIILRYGLPLFTTIVNAILYTYIAALSFYAFMKSKAVRLPRDARVLGYFYLINSIFNLLFLIDRLFLSLQLAPGIPAVVLFVPIFILSWAILFIAWFFPVPGSDGLPVESFTKNFNLTRREKDILEKLLAGKSSSRVAEELFISVRTVDTHIYNIFKKCNVSSRIELISLVRKF